MKRKTELDIDNKTYNWLNELPKIFEDYNNTVHHTIKMKPNEVEDNEEKVKEIYDKIINEKDKQKPKFKIGDNVRIYRKIEGFEKKSGRRFTNEVFQITEIYNTNPITYGLSANNEKLTGKFYSFELSLSK